MMAETDLPVSSMMAETERLSIEATGNESSIISNQVPERRNKPPLSKAVKIPRTEAGYRVPDGNIAAIDFGTTSVSLAYTTKGYEDVNSFVLDPGNQSTRVLSVILLKREEAKLKIVAFGRDARRKFSQLRSGDYPYYLYFERIKMLLKREQNVTRQTLVESFSGEKFYLVEVIAFILKYLKDLLIDHLSRSAKPLKKTDFDWVITVPAIWDARGKRMMREAAYLAGLLKGCDGINQFTPTSVYLFPSDETDSSKLTLALEPESAAIYSQKDTLKEIESDPSAAAISLPSKYMVIDIGGGTVDITSHVEVDGSIVVENIPTGNAWGGTQVNEAFSKLLQGFVGDPGYERYLSTGRKSKQNAIVNQILYKEFEDQKILFGQCKTDEIAITLSNFLPFYKKEAEADEKKMEGVSYEDDTLYLEKEVVESQLFGPAIDGIIKCTLEAIKDKEYKVDTFYLVGGFGGCKYVHQKVEEAIKKFYNSTAHVIVPVSPQLAVAQGAVMWRKNPGKVKARRSDATYGIGITLLFDSQKHDQHYKYNDEENQDICASVFHVFLEKGELVHENEVFKTEGIPPSQESTQVSITIYSTTNPNIQYIEDKEGKSTVTEIGQLLINVPNPDNLPNDERIVDVTMDFSGTEIQAKAKYRVTGEEVKTVCDFLSSQN